MIKQSLFKILQLLMAIAILMALISTTLKASQAGTLTQHVSYFTNQSNLIFALLLLATLGAFSVTKTAWWDALRAAVAFYVLMTGLIYGFMIAPISDLLAWNIDWQGAILHRFAPIFAVLDWIFNPPQRKAKFTRIFVWIIYPLFYVCCAWIRGAVDGWYPYDFLNPVLRGWDQVLLTLVAVILIFVFVAYLVHLIGNLLANAKDD